MSLRSAAFAHVLKECQYTWHADVFVIGPDCVAVGQCSSFVLPDVFFWCPAFSLLVTRLVRNCAPCAQSHMRSSI